MMPHLFIQGVIFFGIIPFTTFVPYQKRQILDFVIPDPDFLIRKTVSRNTDFFLYALGVFPRSQDQRHLSVSTHFTAKVSRPYLFQFGRILKLESIIDKPVFIDDKHTSQNVQYINGVYETVFVLFLCLLLKLSH